MKKSLFVLLLALCAPIQSQARNIVHHFDFQRAVGAAIATGQVDKTASFYLEGAPVPSEIAEKLISVTSAKAARLGDDGVEAACTEALRYVLVVFQRHAKKHGANALVDVVSFFKDREYSDKTQYECHEGSSKAFVTMRGRMVIFK